MQLQTKGSELMRRNLKTLLSTAAVVAALAGGPAVYAYAETPMQNESGSMMQDGQDGMMGQGGMMNMMQQMSQMMETCNNMMQDMSQQPEQEAPKEGVEIGRESGGERVWKYGEITVDVGTLKQTKMTKKKID